jgi:hypothetical protein
MPQCDDCGADLQAVGDPWDGDAQCPYCDTGCRSVQRKVGIGKIVLDSYEQMLAQSGDPADVAAVLIRQAIKKMGFDPDKDEWYVVRDRWSVPPGEEIEQHPCNLYYRPIVIKNTNPASAPWASEDDFSGLTPRCVCGDDESSYKAATPCGEVYMHAMQPDVGHQVDWCGRCGHTRVCCLTWCAERLGQHAGNAYADLRGLAQHHRIRKPIRRK